jgi:dipeptidase E
MAESNPVRRIVAMGGGGFSEEPDNPLLDDFVLRLTGKRKPRVCFIPTASGDAPEYVEKFHAHFPARRAKASHLTLFRGSYPGGIRQFLLEQDALYVGGGSTVNMLAIWRAHGVDRFLREAWRHGIVLAGLSAGMICWFEESVTDSWGGIPKPLHDGLGLLKGSACPHYDSEASRRPAFHNCVVRGQVSAGFAADNGAALCFEGKRLVEAVSSRLNAKAYRVALRAGRVVETALPTRYLGVRCMSKCG